MDYSQKHMKKDLLTHFSFFITYFLLVSLLRRWFSPEYIVLWLGGVIGTFLPDVDHLVYAYILKPKEADSMKASTLISQQEYTKSWNLLIQTQGNKSDLLFHSAFFQTLFAILAFLIVTTSGSLLAKGLVLAFLLHLLIDQVTDLAEKKNMDRWFEGFPISLDGIQKRWFLVGNIVIVLVFGFLF